jgi:Domain of unknown function (DUF4260)
VVGAGDGVMPAVRWQRAEGALVFAAALAILLQAWQPLPWWVALLAFFAPDLSFAGYLGGPKFGAAIYNAVHLYGFGAAVMALGAVQDQPWITSLGFLWLAHAGFDRMLGYGLKLPGGFQDTHLGRIGRGGATR